MDLITKDELNELMENRGDVSLSLFMPTERTGDIQQGPIRLKNLIKDAEQKLQEKNLDDNRIKKFLRPLRDMLEHGEIWKFMNDGLVIYRTDDRFDLYRLPISFKERVVVKERFYIKPLLPLFTNNGQFYVLALSKNEIRLLKGTRFTVDEVEVEGKVPDSLSSILKEVEFPAGFQFHTGSRRAGTVRSAVFHGHGDEIDEKDLIKNYLREVNRGISELLNGEDAPMVIAGVDELRSIYREVNTYPNVLEDGVSGSPARVSNQELHGKAWQIVEPYFTKDVEKEVARFNELNGTGKTTTEIEEAMPAAVQGRIQSLFISTQEEIAGTYDEHGNIMTAVDKSDDNVVDLIDTLVVKALSKGSAVYALNSEDIPQYGRLAAVFRF